jgi:preprotein translocase SecE subunit
VAEESERVVRRIKAKTAEKPKPITVKDKPVKQPIKAKKNKEKGDEPSNYFAGAWHELKQVHWTNRRTTWQLTLAVFLFSAAFALFILAADWVFNWIVQHTVL